MKVREGKGTNLLQDFDFTIYACIHNNEPRHEISNNVVCATSNLVYIKGELSPSRSTSKVLWHSGEIACIISSLCLR